MNEKAILSTEQQRKNKIMTVLLQIGVFGFMVATTCIQPVFADDVFDTFKKMFNDLGTSLVGFYQALFWPLFLVDLILLAFVLKDEKQVAIAKKALIWLIVIMVLVSSKDFIISIANWFIKGVNGTQIGVNSPAGP